MKQEMFTPFRRGTEAADWYDNNCTRCVKAFFPKVDGDWPSDATMKQYCSIGKECKLKYAIDVAFITGEIPMNIAVQIGIDMDFGGLKETCMMFSDNEDDGYRPTNQPDPEDPNQLCMPFFSVVEESLSRKELA